MRDAPLAGSWRRLPGYVRHVFTHFPLELAVFTATFGTDTQPPAGGRWVPRDGLAGEALPNVMRKVLEKALEG